ncbi:MAG: hypothetical protein LBQ88_18715 [Treponema sp.]|jgi:hypothetical protein|nr:hypothetical protein [Treponema sp.]
MVKIDSKKTALTICNALIQRALEHNIMVKGSIMHMAALALMDWIRAR